MPIFLNPMLLAGMLAAGIPLALHLLSQRNPRPTPFSTLRFIETAIAKTRKSRKLTQILVLLLRVLVMILLALAFAQPSIRRGAWLPEGARSVVLIIDGSASMQTRDVEETCFEKARAWSLTLLRDLQDKDRAAVIVLGQENPRVIYPPVSDRPLVEKALKEMTVGNGRVELVPEIGRLLPDLVGKSRGTTVEVHVFSDFQRTSWDAGLAGELATRLRATDIRFFANDVGATAPGNAWIQSLELFPEAILGPGDITARARVRASDSFAGANTARLYVDGKEAADRGLNLAGDHEETVVLVAPVPPDAHHATGRVTLDTDPLNIDNTRYFALERRDQLRVLLVDGGGTRLASQADSYYVQRALNPMRLKTPLIQATPIVWRQLGSQNLAEFQAVIVCNPPEFGAGEALPLEDYVDGGGTLILYPGPRGGLRTSYRQIKALRDLDIQPEKFLTTRTFRFLASQRPTDVEQRVRGLLGGNPSFAGTERLQIREVGRDQRSFFHLDEDTPAMLLVPYGRGVIWLSALAANRSWSEWPLDPSFPIFHQVVIREGFGRQKRTQAVDIGRTAVLPWAGEELSLNLEIKPPEASAFRRIVERQSQKQDYYLDVFDTPGLYRVTVMARQPETRYVAANIPADESNLTPVGREELRGQLRGAEVYYSRTAAQQRDILTTLTTGRPLWPFLLLLAFILGIAEELFANLRSWQKAAPDSLKQALRWRRS